MQYYFYEDYYYRLNRTVSFIGEDCETLGLTEEKVRELLKPVIEEVILSGFKFFRTNMTKGFSTISAEMIEDSRDKEPYDGLRLICCLPFSNYTKGWEKEDKDYFKTVYKRRNMLIITPKKYGKYRTKMCNKHMIDDSKLLITAFCGKDEDVSDAVKYAKEKNIEIINIID